LTYVDSATKFASRLLQNISLRFESKADFT